MAEPVALLTTVELAAIRTRYFSHFTESDAMVYITHGDVARLLATVEAYREIVAAVADGWSNALGTRVGASAAEGLALKARARALLGEE